MEEYTVGIRELKARLSEYLKQVRAGRTITITNRGRPVGRLMPPDQALEKRVQRMIEAGLAEWNGQPLPPVKPSHRLARGKTIADLIIEDRR